jgi:magnesium-transporting ATPase (P-type)
MANASLKPSTWHTLDLDALTKTLETSEHGLTSTEATARLDRYGPNTLPAKPPLTMAQIALDQFRSPLIYILGAAAVVSLLIKEPTDAAFIAGVLVLNALIGAYQEWKAQASSMALQKLLRIRATVLRDGEAREVGAEELVPGDVVWLESGNRVPADLRLSSTNGLAVDESLLTGESYPVTKQSDWIGGSDVPLADRRNMAHAGSIVTRGRAKGWVVATGKNTAVGQLAVDVIAAKGGETAARRSHGALHPRHRPRHARRLGVANRRRRLPARLLRHRDVPRGRGARRRRHPGRASRCDDRGAFRSHDPNGEARRHRPAPRRGGRAR